MGLVLLDNTDVAEICRIAAAVETLHVHARLRPTAAAGRHRLAHEPARTLLSLMDLPSGIGFIGLGVMGLPMAEHLLAAGHNVVINTRTRAASLAQSRILEVHGEHMLKRTVRAGLQGLTIRRS